jgi:hypothetical protein
MLIKVTYLANKKELNFKKSQLKIKILDENLETTFLISRKMVGGRGGGESIWTISRFYYYLFCYLKKIPGLTYLNCCIVHEPNKEKLERNF